MPGSGPENHLTIYISDEDAKIIKRAKKRLGNDFNISGTARRAIVEQAEYLMAKKAARKTVKKRSLSRR